MEIVKSIQQIQERFVEENSSNPSPEKRCASRLEGKGKIVEKEKEKKNSMKTFYKFRFGFVRNVVPRGVQVKSQLSKDITKYKSRALDSFEFHVYCCCATACVRLA